jgi:rod shape-determining protein MreD
MRRQSETKIRFTPALTVMLASMAPVAPIIVTIPILPPLGFMLFVCWRLIHKDIWAPWAGALLGLFDDIWSGQPLGSGMVLWALTQMILDVVERRILWRDYWRDWALAGMCIAAMLSAALFIANETGGHLRWVYIVPQIIIAIFAHPLVMRVCAWFDAWRLR